MLPGAELRFVAHAPGQVPTDRNILVVGATHSFDETLDPDLVIVPGSESQTGVAAADCDLSDWLRKVHRHTRYPSAVRPK